MRVVLTGNSETLMGSSKAIVRVRPDQGSPFVLQVPVGGSENWDGRRVRVTVETIGERE